MTAPYQRFIISVSTVGTVGSVSEGTMRPNGIHGLIGTVGSVSEGTMRPEDLIPIFCGELEKLDPGNTLAREIEERMNPDIEDSPPARDNPYWDSEDCIFDLNSLISALSELAPDDCTFGASEGDAADFGFWPCA